MLNKKYRFHSRGGVRYVFQKGKTVRTQKMSLTTLDNERGFTRVAVVVSKKVLKTAVGRNRIRRRIYEAVRRNFEDLPKNRDYIFSVFTKEVAVMPNKELEKILGDLVADSRIS
ncbi:ribonuclease P protein component [Candidatus Saccharibacteria bacterium]|nr:ribonuclease P protein component [Candidatus Saccharibacteria bacterium]